MAQTAEPVQLKHQTTDAFEAYVHEAEAQMTPRSGRKRTPFSGQTRRVPSGAQQVRKGRIVARTVGGQRTSSECRTV